MTRDTYEGWGFLFGGVAFVGAWLYCIATYGFLFGVGLGWLPAAIVGGLVFFCWPVLAVLLVAGGLLLVAALAR